MADDFYIGQGECLSCGVPSHVAPDLIQYDATGHCQFIKQPETAAEFKQVIAAINGSCVCAVRYRGTDKAILAQIALEDSVDHPISRLKYAIDPPEHRSILTQPEEGFFRQLLRRFR